MACCLAPATAGAATRATAPGAPATGATFAGFLDETACVTANDCWAVGQTDSQFAAAEHWNGSAWSMVPVAGPPGAINSWLPSVSCASRTDCWAVGEYEGSTGKQVAYAEHWDGTAWSPVAVRVPSGSVLPLLNSVSCASTDSCWASGIVNGTTYMERFNGRAWTDVRSPGLGSETDIQRVSCPSATDCWVSGNRGIGSHSGTLTGHWTGGAWAVVTTPTSHNPGDRLVGISCHANTCMTVGDRNANPNPNPLAQRWNGSAWTVTPTGIARASLSAVSCVSDGTCMAVGGTDGGNGRVFTERWAGMRWRVVPAPTPAVSKAASLVGVACVSSMDCWGVGNYVSTATGDRSLIEHWNGHAWSVVS
ncbi:MAG TPA: hypothetical protein VGS19_33635 [Streptosporangiaceae bacterium]|nr:hypothetical protein [Streptosporangiaceae bacterium]